MTYYRQDIFPGKDDFYFEATEWTGRGLHLSLLNRSYRKKFLVPGISEIAGDITITRN
jgi:hypothetical protein